MRRGGRRRQVQLQHDAAGAHLGAGARARWARARTVRPAGEGEGVHQRARASRRGRAGRPRTPRRLPRRGAAPAAASGRARSRLRVPGLPERLAGDRDGQPRAARARRRRRTGASGRRRAGRLLRGSRTSSVPSARTTFATVRAARVSRPNGVCTANERAAPGERAAGDAVAVAEVVDVGRTGLRGGRGVARPTRRASGSAWVRPRARRGAPGRAQARRTATTPQRPPT